MLIPRLITDINTEAHKTVSYDPADTELHELIHARLDSDGTIRLCVLRDERYGISRNDFEAMEEILPSF